MADLVYARLVLAHLPDPLATADAWPACLRPGGRVLIEDLEGIDAPAGPLRSYDDLAAAVVRAGGGLMYAGAPLLPSAAGPHRSPCPPPSPPRSTSSTCADGGRRPRQGCRSRSSTTCSPDSSRLSPPIPATVSWIVRQLVLC